MKKLLLVFTAFSFLFLNAYAQTDAEKKQIETSVSSIFDFASKQNADEIAKFIVYQGNDAARNLKDTYNVKQPKEMGAVQRLSKKVKAFLDLSESYQITGYSQKTAPEGTTNIVEINFNSGKQSLKTKFSFLQVGGKYLLLDIE